MDHQPNRRAERRPQQGLPLPTEDWFAVLASAGAAPSAHNTQPWRFMVWPEVVELHVDPARTLSVADPTGREARISCGAALFNLRMALRARDIDPLVALLPWRSHPTLLAVVRPQGMRIATPQELALFRAIPRRHSHRRPFHSAPVPQAALRSIVYAAGVEGGYLRLLPDPPTVSAVAAIVGRADQVQRHSQEYQDELADWTFTGGGRTDGVPAAAGGPQPEPGALLAMRDFAPAGSSRPTGHYESDPLLGVLLSAGDTPRDQLRSGQALQRALLTATDHGVGASMLSAPIELPAARAALRDLLDGAMWPQLVLRFGSALPTAASPRRPVSEFAQLAAADRIASAGA